MNNLRIFGDVTYEGVYEFENSKNLKEIYIEIEGKKNIKLIQVGGPLGRLLINNEVNLTLSELKNDLIENSIVYYDEVFCLVDFMRFMLRFTMRELNIVNETLREVYKLVDKMTNGKIDLLGFNYFKILISESGKTKAEELLYKNLRFVIAHFNNEVDEHVIDKYCRNSICRGLFKAQCINACPAHIHIPGFIALMKEDRIQEAYQLMRQENPLSSVCGSICARPCELRCRRGEITSTIGVRALQRFISNSALGIWPEEKVLADNNKSIGIVGGGPSGLTAAYYLKKTGYSVTIYEANDEVGGMLSFGVPSYRLPSKSLKEEVETIKSIGVKIQTNVRVGIDIDIRELKNSHDAVLLATGATIGNKLELNHYNVISAIDFLKSVRQNDKKEIGRNVLVVGGGDVSLDCARTAIRLGSQVNVSSLEEFEFMPASYDEKIQGLEEGINFISGFGIKCIDDGNIFFKKCIQVVDDCGKFSPLFSDVTLKLKTVDTIILAIGQKSDLSYLDKSLINERGFIKLNDGYKVSNKLYACGDMIKPTIVIDAIAQGKKSAILIDKDLGGSGLYIGSDINIPELVLNITTFDNDIKLQNEISIKERKNTFNEITEVFSLDDAKYEADRCMRCDRNSQDSLLLGR